MDRILLIVGCSVFGWLGLVHLYLTFFSNRFEARDSKVSQGMRDSSPILTGETSVWKAWIGFNASHSLGALWIPAFYLPLTLFHYPLIEASLWFRWLPVLMGCSYLVLARRYWFRAPFFGILLATGCFLSSSLLAVLK